MTTETTVTPRPGLGGLLVGIFIRPRRTLRAIAEHNGQGWWIPLLIMLALTVTVAAVSGPLQAKEMREQIAKMQDGQTRPGQQQGDPEQMEQTLNFATSPVFTVVFPAATGVIGLVIGWLIQAGLLYLSATVLGGRTRFGALWGITLWAAMPFAIRGLLQTSFITLSGSIIKNPGLSGLIERPNGDPLAALQIPTGQLALISALGQIDLFVIWNLVLLIIGLKVAAGFSARKAALIIIGFWLLGAGANILAAIAGASFAAGSMG